MHGSAPFLLVGPFGTGKTRTLIEFLRRLVAQRKPGQPHAARVLVCSPSNSSVDKYVTALQELLGPEQMLRIQAPHRSLTLTLTPTLTLTLTLTLTPTLTLTLTLTLSNPKS